MEDKKENERVAVLEIELKNLSGQMDRIEKKLDYFANNFLTRKEADMMFESQNKQIEDIEKRLETNDSNKRANLSLIVAALTLVGFIVFNIITLTK